MPLDTNHYWHEQSYYSVSSGTFSAYYTCEYLYKLEKDTIISSNSYKKIIMKNKVCQSSSYPPSAPLKSFVREDTILKRVIVLDNSYQEKILYNFNKNIGDTANLFNGTTVKTYSLTAKDSILLNDGLYHKRFMYDNGTGGTFQVITGVGGVYGLFTPYVLGIGSGTNLLCTGKTYPILSTIYHIDGATGTCSPIITSLHEFEESNKPYISIYPIPTSYFLNISANDFNLSNSTIKITNTLGQIIFTSIFVPQIDISQLIQGIYFLTVQDNSNEKTVKIIKQ